MKPAYHHIIALSIALIVFVVSVGGYVFIYNKIGAQADRTAAAFASVETEQMSAVKEKILTKSLESSRINRELVKTFMVPVDQTVPFIEQIEGISKQSGASVFIASVAADDINGSATGTTGNLSAHVIARGSWADVMRTAHIIENLPYPMSINNVRMSGGTTGWTMDLDIATLIVK